MATDFDDAQKQVEQLFAAGWGSTTKIAYDNLQFNPDEVNDDSWVRLNVIDGTAEQVGLGAEANLYRHPGVVIVQVFVKEGQGIRVAKQLADQVAAIFRGTTSGGVLYRTPSVERIGPNGGWFQVNVNIPFQWDAQF